MLPWVRGWYKEIQRKAKSRRRGGMSRPSTSSALILCGRHKGKDGRYKVSGADSEERTGAADKAMFQLVEVQPCQLLVSDT